MVNCQAKRCTNFILAPVAATDRPRLVIKNSEALLKHIANSLRLLRVSIFTEKRKNSHFDWGKSRFQSQYNTRLVVLYVFVVGVEQGNQQNTVHSHRRFND